MKWHPSVQSDSIRAKAFNYNETCSRFVPFIWYLVLKVCLSMLSEVKLPFLTRPINSLLHMTVWAGLPRCKHLWYFLFVSLACAGVWLLFRSLLAFCFLCFTSSVSFTGFCTEDEPIGVATRTNKILSIVELDSYVLVCSCHTGWISSCTVSNAENPVKASPKAA